MTTNATRRRRVTSTEPAPTFSYINEPLRQFAVPVDSLTPDPENPRIHDQINMEAITASLAEFGQAMPIVVQREGMIVRIGNGRLQAAKDLGWTHIAAVVTDKPEAVMKALGIADNRTGELASWNHAELARLLDEIQLEVPDLINSVGFDMREIETLLTRYLPDVTLQPDVTPPVAEAGEGGGTPLSGEVPTSGGGTVGQAFQQATSGARYVNFSFTSEEFEKYGEAVQFFKRRYNTTITPEALLKALTEYMESLNA